MLILTAVMFIQFKTVKQTDFTSLENMREDELRTGITNFKQKTEETNKRLEEVNAKQQNMSKQLKAIQKHQKYQQKSQSNLTIYQEKRR